MSPLRLAVVVATLVNLEAGCASNTVPAATPPTIAAAAATPAAAGGRPTKAPAVEKLPNGLTLIVLVADDADGLAPPR